jgi:hypothetical protein
VIAAEIIDENRHKSFSSRHLAEVLDRCFTTSELDNQAVTEAKENVRDEQKPQIEKSVKGLIHKCLEKDKSGFEPLNRVKGESKEVRLSVLSECRPSSCRTAVDLFLWLVEVNLLGAHTLSEVADGYDMPTE